MEYYSAMSFPAGEMAKNLPTNAGVAGDMGSIPVSSGGGNGDILQYSCWNNPMNRGP